MKPRTLLLSHPWLNPFVKEFSYSDPLRSQSPDFDLTISRYSEDLPIYPGELVEVAIAYKGEQYQLNAGSFQVDKVSVNSNKYTIQASGLPLNTTDIKEQRDNDYSEQYLSEILEDVASRYALEVFTPNLPDISFSNLQQTQQSDLEFLNQIANTLGAVFKIESNRLIFTSLLDLEMRSPTFSLDSKNLLFDTRTDEITAINQYQFLNYEIMLFGELLEIQVEDSRISNGKSTNFRGAGLLADDDNLMELGAREKLRQINGEGWKTSFSCAGNPYLVAGSTFYLDGRLAFCDRVRHEVSSFWIASIDARFIPQSTQI